MKKSYKIILACLVLLLLALVVGNFYAKLQLKKSLDEVAIENDFSYEDASVSLLFGEASLVNIDFTKNGFGVTASKVSLNGFSYWDYLFSEKLHIASITFGEPDITIRPHKKVQKDTASKSSKPLRKVITIGKVELEDGLFEAYDSLNNLNNKVKLNQFAIEGITVSDSILKEKIPFHYNHIQAKIDSVYLKINKYQDIRIANIQIEDDTWDISQFNIIPKYGRAELQKVIPYEKDLITVSIPKLKITELKLSEYENKVLVRSPLITIHKADANIYRDKNAPDDTRIKPMYSEMLRELSFGLIIDELKVEDSNLVYEEVVKGKKEPGKVIFNNLNVLGKHISNTSFNDELPITTLRFNTGFMDSASLQVFWQFNVNNEADYFKISGKGTQVSANDINNFFVPAVNVKAVGSINEIDFDFSGNVESAKGNMSMMYKDFGVQVLRKDGKEKNKFLTSIANLIINNKAKNGEVDKKDIEATRDKTKSFWNYFWLCIRNGALESLI